MQPFIYRKYMHSSTYMHARTALHKYENNVAGPYKGQLY